MPRKPEPKVSADNGRTHVWIEVQKPKDDAEGQATAEKLNNMLTRLADPKHLPLTHKFRWSSHERRFCFGGDMGDSLLTDHGVWLNLDYLGRPL